MKSRHLIALATGACLGLAGLGQTAFADRGGDGDEERSRGCSADHENSSENEIGDSDQDGGLLGLIGLGSVGLNGTSIGLLDNLLCGSSLLNDLNLAILGEVDDDDEGDRESEVECSANHENSSENSIGDSEQSGGLLSLIQLGSVGSNGLSLGALNNLLCGADVLNDLNVAILGEVDDDDEGDRESEVTCSADHENSSDNSVGDADQGLGLLSLLGLNSLNLNGTSAGLLGNVGCGSSIGNGIDIAILSGLGLF
jgi:hypothetical protein